MFKLIRNIFAKIAISAIIILSVVNCTKDQNSFLPYKKVDLHFSLANYNHLKIPGNSVLFQLEGYKGLIVVCVDPTSNQYYAYDACCPYEKDYSGTVTVQPIKNLPSPPNTVFSSDWIGVCNKCGSEFNLMGGGRPNKGPATHYLQSYYISIVSDYLTVTN